MFMRAAVTGGGGGVLVSAPFVPLRATNLTYYHLTVTTGVQLLCVRARVVPATCDGWTPFYSAAMVEIFFVCLFLVPSRSAEARVVCLAANFLFDTTSIATHRSGASAFFFFVCTSPPPQQTHTHPGSTRAQHFDSFAYACPHGASLFNTSPQVLEVGLVLRRAGAVARTGHNLTRRSTGSVTFFRSTTCCTDTRNFLIAGGAQPVPIASPAELENTRGRRRP